MKLNVASDSHSSSGASLSSALLFLFCFVLFHFVFQYCTAFSATELELTLLLIGFLSTSFNIYMTQDLVSFLCSLLSASTPTPETIFGLEMFNHPFSLDENFYSNERLGFPSISEYCSMLHMWVTPVPKGRSSMTTRMNVSWSNNNYYYHNTKTLTLVILVCL